MAFRGSLSLAGCKDYSGLNRKLKVSVRFIKEIKPCKPMLDILTLRSNIKSLEAMSKTPLRLGRLARGHRKICCWLFRPRIPRRLEMPRASLVPACRS